MSQASEGVYLPLYTSMINPTQLLVTPFLALPLGPHNTTGEVCGLRPGSCCWTSLALNYFESVGGLGKNFLNCHSKPSPSPLVPKPALVLTAWGKAVPTLPTWKPLSMNSMSSAPHTSLHPHCFLWNQRMKQPDPFSRWPTASTFFATPLASHRNHVGRCLWFLQGLTHSWSAQWEGGQDVLRSYLPTREDPSQESHLNIWRQISFP